MTVSIHAPSEREERPVVTELRPSLFQSTPPSGERSDVDPRNHFVLQLRKVSIHAPLRREERPV